MCNNLFETDEMLEFDNIFQQSLLFLIDITVPQALAVESNKMCV